MRTKANPTLPLSSTTAGRRWSGSCRSAAPTFYRAQAAFTCLQFLTLALCAMVVLIVWSQAIAATVTLAWDASPTPEVTGYRVYRSLGNGPFEPILQVTNLTAQAAVSDTNSTRFYVKAYTSAALESEPSNTVTNLPTAPPPDPPTAPGQPTIIYVNRISGMRVDIGWATKDLTSTSQLWRMVDSQPWRLIGTLTPGNLHWSDTSAHHRRTFSYRVASCNNIGCSPFSSVASLPGDTK